MQSRLDEIKKAGEVFGISVDSQFAQAKWAELEGWKVPMLSDINKEVATAYDTLRMPAGIAKRSAFLVDKQGKVAKMQYVEVAGELPDMDGFINELKKLA